MKSPAIYIQSSHASLEFDQARMLTDMGIPVYGNFDVGSQQRRKIPGVTDRNSDIADFDLIVLHQVPEYCDRMHELLVQGKRVILSAFGQSDTWQYEAVAKLCRDYPYAWVSPYSTKDWFKYQECGCPSQKNRLIRFGKYLDDFKPWVGEGGFAYTSCNDIHHRGHGCGWDLMKQVMEQVPIILSGKRTDEVGGMGEVAEDVMHNLLSQASCFVSFGTAPAPWVLTQMEAWCAGCPVVIYDNGHGIAQEPMPLILCHSVDEVVQEVRKMIHDAEHRHRWHEMSVQNAQLFDVKRIGPQWKQLITEVMA